MRRVKLVAVLGAAGTGDVVLAIVTGVFGLVAGFLPTWYSARAQRRADRQALRRELAGTFVQRLGGAAEAVRHAVQSPEQKALQDARWLLGEVAALLPSLRLRVPAAAGGAARTAVEELRTALDRLEAGVHEEGSAAYDRARTADDELVATLADIDDY